MTHDAPAAAAAAAASPNPNKRPFPEDAGSMAVVKLSVKWGKESFSDVEVDLSSPPLVFKSQLFALTNVPPDRQKVMIKGVLLKDDDWGKAAPKDGATVMLMGSAEAVSVEAPKNAPKFLEDLPQSEQDHMDTKSFGAGLVNLGNTCYMNSTMQCMFAVRPLREALVGRAAAGGAGGSGADTSTSLVAATRDLFRDLDRGGAPFPPIAFLLALRGKFPQFAQTGAGGAFMQQDAEECWTNVMYTLREKLKVAAAVAVRLCLGERGRGRNSCTAAAQRVSGLCLAAAALGPAPCVGQAGFLDASPPPHTHTAKPFCPTPCRTARGAQWWTSCLGSARTSSWCARSRARSCRCGPGPGAGPAGRRTHEHSHSSHHSRHSHSGNACPLAFGGWAALPPRGERGRFQAQQGLRAKGAAYLAHTHPPCARTRTHASVHACAGVLPALNASLLGTRKQPSTPSIPSLTPSRGRDRIGCTPHTHERTHIAFVVAGVVCCVVLATPLCRSLGWPTR